MIRRPCTIRIRYRLRESNHPSLSDAQAPESKTDAKGGNSLNCRPAPADAPATDNPISPTANEAGPSQSPDEGAGGEDKEQNPPSDSDGGDPYQKRRRIVAAILAGIMGTPLAWAVHQMWDAGTVLDITMSVALTLMGVFALYKTFEYMVPVTVDEIAADLEKIGADLELWGRREERRIQRRKAEYRRAKFRSGKKRKWLL